LQIITRNKKPKPIIKCPCSDFPLCNVYHSVSCKKKTNHQFKKSKNPYAFNNAVNIHFLPNDILVIPYTVKTLTYGMEGKA